jgi:hypothetical protein
MVSSNIYHKQQDIHLIGKDTSLSFMFPQTHDRFVQEFNTCECCQKSTDQVKFNNYPLFGEVSYAEKVQDPERQAQLVSSCRWER